MKKIKEPVIFEEVWQCPRCIQDHCGECVEKITVDFWIKDKSEGMEQMEVEWEGLLVCPWCYNQLIDKATQKPKSSEEEK